MGHTEYTDLEQLAKRKGYTQEQLARAVGISLTYMREVLKRRAQNPSISVAGPLAMILGCTVEELWPQVVQTHE